MIGVLGVATNATLKFFEQWASVFPAEKEWDRPRVIIDNNCTTPSRVRALLYDENTELLVDLITESIKLLVNSGCYKILIACNTAHVFLDEIYKKFPEARNYIVDIIDSCAELLQKQNVKEVFIMASEGTILSGIYEKTLQKRGIKCFAPSPEEFPILRSFIEAVKQDNCTEEIKKLFVDFISSNVTGVNVVLGCTDMPVLYDKCKDQLKGINFYDPMMIALKNLQKEFALF